MAISEGRLIPMHWSFDDSCEACIFLHEPIASYTCRVQAASLRSLQGRGMSGTTLAAKPPSILEQRSDDIGHIISHELGQSLGRAHSEAATAEGTSEACKASPVLVLEVPIGRWTASP